MNTVKYRDAFAAGYKITPISRTNKTILETSSDLITDVRLNRELLDYDYFYSNCLVTVNGYYHRIDTDSSSGIFVLDAMKSLKIANKNQIGITNFKDVGGITTLSISDTELKYNNDKTVKIKVPVSLVDKTLLLSYGGYLLHVDNLILSQVNDNIFKLDLSAMPIPEMYYESKKYLNYDGIPIEHSINNENLISIEDLYSDEFITYIMSLSQTFLILVNSTNIKYEKIPVRCTGLPGQYISYSKPEYPLVLGYGRHAEYWVRYEDTQYSITVTGNTEDRLIYNTIDNNNEISVSSNKEPEYINKLSRGYLLKIYS